MTVELKIRGEEDYELTVDKQTAMYISRTFGSEKPSIVISREQFDEITIVVVERVKNLEEAKKVLENVGKGVGLKYEITIGGFKTISP